MLVLLLLALASIGRPASAGETDPYLLVTRAVAADVDAGTLVRVDAEFPWNALLQSGFPLGLVVWQTDGPTRFARFGLDGSPVGGVSPLLADGLTPSELGGFLGHGTANPDNLLVAVAEGRIEVRLDDGFLGAPLAVQLYVIDTGTPFVSNAYPVVRSGQ